jgi:hypothetical protein
MKLLRYVPDKRWTRWISTSFHCLDAVIAGTEPYVQFLTSALALTLYTLS